MEDKKGMVLSNSPLTALVDYLPVGVGIADTKGNLLYFNDAMLAQGGWTKEDVEKIGNVAGLYFDPGERAKVLGIFASSGKVDKFPVRFRSKAGGFYPTAMSLRGIQFMGKPAVLAIVENRSAVVTAKEESNKAIKDLEDTKLAMLNLLEDLENDRDLIEREKKRDEIIFSSIGWGLVVCDKNGVIGEVNQAFEKMTGYSREESMGKKLTHLLPMYDESNKPIDEAERPITKVVSLGVKLVSIGTASVANYYLKKDKTKLFTSGSVTPVVVNNMLTGAVEVFSDISKELEVEKLKDDFVSMASHELRTPLAAIDGLVSMIQDGEYGEVNDSLKEPLRDITSSSERLIRLVNDLLNLSRIQAGRLKYTLSEFSLLEAINETVKLMVPVAEQKGITISASHIVDTKVQGDLDKVKQVLSNLVGNSFKFTDKGSITITTKDEADMVEVSVTDTGIGIPIEEQTKLFGKFQQLDSGRGRPMGTGLGLFLSREMARKMGGSVDLGRSEPGKGSTFVFSLPKFGSPSAKKAKEAIDQEAQEHPDQKSG